ncbi:uncharacterized protein LOC111377533 [Olea europaea var. sylvestris]|uniref:uncharacterized protein LOC111377533 n=1 Tax=Olea europaea var. sylvestris TaxID=158386 RepID=UPI000C1D05B5|nr:uncharacterized protein LOC111377533 [Olea europaea var. sylvestris]
MAESKVRLKLLIDTKGKRVLFAEAGKDFVDFIFHVLALPLATVIRLLGKQEMVGCLGNLYDSIENLSDSYIQVGQNKNILLKPMPPTSVPILLLNDKPTRKIFYRCGNCYSSSNNVTDNPTAACPNCNHLMNRTLNYVAPPGTVNKGSNEGKGFVKDVVIYMVMDDLMVKPISNISSIALLNKFNVNELAALQEKEVNFGLNEITVLNNNKIYHPRS